MTANRNAKRIPSVGLLIALALASILIPGSARAAQATHALPRPAQPPDPPQPVAMHRLGGNVWEYDYLLTMGTGPFNQVGVHRVVQVEDGKPIVAPKSVFLAHGDIWGFNGAFLGGTHSDYSMPVYLASKGVDVWGIDLGWTLIPAGANNLTPLKSWNLQRDVTDLERAIAVARQIRAATGSPSGPMPLLGWSRGGWIGYALLNEETQLPPSQRQVSGFISVDNDFKTDDPATQSFWCSTEQAISADIAAHFYAFDDTAYSQAGTLAENDPNGTSPFDPPLTNLQFSLVVGAATFQFGPTFTPFYHFVAGTFPNNDVTAMPTALRYTSLDRWEQFLASSSPYEPTTMELDTAAITCGDTPSPYDDHLADIRVPVFYVGAGGGFGSAGLYALSLLGSTDKTSMIVSFQPPDNAGLDFGHVDLFNASNAEQAVWNPIYHWLNAHAT